VNCYIETLHHKFRTLLFNKNLEYFGKNLGNQLLFLLGKEYFGRGGQNILNMSCDMELMFEMGLRSNASLQFIIFL